MMFHVVDDDQLGSIFECSNYTTLRSAVSIYRSHLSDLLTRCTLTDDSIIIPFCSGSIPELYKLAAPLVQLPLPSRGHRLLSVVTLCFVSPYFVHHTLRFSIYFTLAGCWVFYSSILTRTL